MKKFLKVLLGIVIFFIAVVAIAFFVLLNGKDKVEALQVHNPNLTAVADGTYIGSSDLTRWSNRLEVRVLGHKITDIKILDDVLIKMDTISQPLFERVIQNQSLDVDIETGATLTSKAYLKSIETALGGKQ